MLTAAALDLDDRFEFHVERARRPNRPDVGERGQVGHRELVERGGEIVNEPEVDRELLEQAPGDRRIDAETDAATVPTWTSPGAQAPGSARGRAQDAPAAHHRFREAGAVRGADRASPMSSPAQTPDRSNGRKESSRSKVHQR